MADKEERALNFKDCQHGTEAYVGLSISLVGMKKKLTKGPWYDLGLATGKHIGTC